AQLRRHGAAHRIETALGRGVVGHAGHAVENRHAAADDDGATRVPGLGALHHMAGRLPQGVDGAVEVDVEQVVVHLRGHVADGVGTAGHARITIHTVDTTLPHQRVV